MYACLHACMSEGIQEGMNVVLWMSEGMHVCMSCLYALCGRRYIGMYVERSVPFG